MRQSGAERWEFAEHGQPMMLEVSGNLTLDNLEIMADTAARGIGIAYVPERTVARYLRDGVPEDWCPPVPGLLL